jgi:hypothetical protein
MLDAVLLLTLMGISSGLERQHFNEVFSGPKGVEVWEHLV